MLVLLSCAKTMQSASRITVPFTTDPLFQREAATIALELSSFTVEQLEEELQVNPKIALDNFNRFQSFHSPDTPSLPALLAYTGIVFKRLDPKSFSAEDFTYAQDHLRLTSFCYGLLRPLDRIKPYRLEGDVILPGNDGVNMYHYWRNKLTMLFIEEIKKAGGVLINLASQEMKLLFDWKAVERQVRVITPEFYTWKNGKFKTIVIYTKMARGEMTRMILTGRIENPEEIKQFDWEGFTFDPVRSQGDNWIFIGGGDL